MLFCPGLYSFHMLVCFLFLYFSIQKVVRDDVECVIDIIFVRLLERLFSLLSALVMSLLNMSPGDKMHSPLLTH